MKSRDFCYWLQGFFEINEGKKTLSTNQVEMIKKHLHLVFEHEIDPSFGKEQDKLKKIHNQDLDNNSYDLLDQIGDGRIMC